MKFELENGRPRDGDLVRMNGKPDGPIMEVLAAELGEEHDWEGVRNGIYCTWEVEGESIFEVFRPGQLVIVDRPGD
ncbi:hypothetical protein GJ699_02685 [Duganella sp. FT80W]|uniref:Uncharacterized protein n=1 Tax=Duganella guangzhouensis TaxID=2666084 RepID=A0A6I2KSQ3_9BURK|nr:hypothetical protein [Duganella guangzhouensis]MRW88885.1 hypothetical protein [Duganella guangzhouensis]